MIRLLFGKPIRESTTQCFYPDKISIEDFGCILDLSQDHEFITNLRYLYGDNLEERYAEEWAEIFLAYCEIEHE